MLVQKSEKNWCSFNKFKRIYTGVITDFNAFFNISERVIRNILLFFVLLIRWACSFNTVLRLNCFQRGVFNINYFNISYCLNEIHLNKITNACLFLFSLLKLIKFTGVLFLDNCVCVEHVEM